MDVQDLDDAATELYALTPADFTARRAELVAQARVGGLKDLAKAVSELRRPTVSAWLVNQLARGAAGAEEEIHELETLGADLREAQAQLDAPRMKECAKRRHELVAALLRRADTVGDEEGQKVSAGARRELEETFGAAIADEQAGLAVTSGRLTRALVYAGFGDVDVSEATATPVTKQRHLQSTSKSRSGEAKSAGTTDGGRRSAPGRSGKAGGGRGEADRHGRVEAGQHDRGTGTGHGGTAAEPTDSDIAAEQTDGDTTAEQAAAEQADAEALAAREEAIDAADVARADEAAAIDEFEAAERRRDDVRAQEVRLTDSLTELQREIVRVRHELDDLTRSMAAADREYQRRQRQVDQARRAVQHADRALERLTDD
jgi:hypothetical protein